MSDTLVRAGTAASEPRSRLVVRAGDHVTLLSATSDAPLTWLGERVIVTGSVWSESTVASQVIAVDEVGA